MIFVILDHLVARVLGLVRERPAVSLGGLGRKGALRVRSRIVRHPCRDFSLASESHRRLAVLLYRELAVLGILKGHRRNFAGSLVANRDFLLAFVSGNEFDIGISRDHHLGGSERGIPPDESGIQASLLGFVEYT